MPITIIIGGQFGSEGKGKISHYLAKKQKAEFVVRIGGPNAGHTVITPSGKKRIFKQLPTAAILPKPTLIIAAGSYIHLPTLFKELVGINPNRILIDPKAVIITQAMRKKESLIMTSIGSTGSGTGAAVMARISRNDPSIIFAGDLPNLHPFLSPTTLILSNALQNNKRIIIEGTQGFGLSPIHSPYYPFVTARDTTAAAFLSETGLSPADVDNITMVLRTHPIRVAGNSGPLPKETTWEKINTPPERTSVTRQIRRVAHINPDIIQIAINTNHPTTIALNHLDYLPKNNINPFILKLENSINQQIDLLGFGPDKTLTKKEYADKS